MMLNATIIVQFVNFFVAYLLIDRILLRKAVSIIQQERQEHATLMAEIQHEREHVNNREVLKVEKWHAIRKIFAKRIPKKQELPEVKIPEVTLDVSVSSAEMDRYRDQVEKVLIRRVGDGIE